jgi:hypothetical protein
MEVRGVTGQNDYSAWWIRLQFIGVKLIPQADVKDSRNDRVYSVLRVPMGHHLRAVGHLDSDQVRSGLRRLTNENSEACFWREGWERPPIDVVRKNCFESRLAWLMGSRHSRGRRRLIFCHGNLLLTWPCGLEKFELWTQVSEDARDERSKPPSRISTDGWCPQYRLPCMADLSSRDDLRRDHHPLAAKVLINAVIVHVDFKFPITRAASTDRRNTKLEPSWQCKQKPKSIARVRPAGTLPWLGSGRAQPIRWQSRGSIAESMHWIVLHRPVELARVTGHLTYRYLPRTYRWFLGFR